MNTFSRSFQLVKESYSVLRKDKELMLYPLISGAVSLVLIGFLALSRGLQLTPVVRVNILNASQVAMATTAGIVIFRESPNLCVAVGIGMTIVGMFCVDAPPGQPIADQHA